MAKSQSLLKMILTYFIAIDYIDYVWLIASILSMRQMLEYGWTWGFAWMIYNSIPWIRRELHYVYNDCSDDATELLEMIPDLRLYLPFLER